MGHIQKGSVEYRPRTYPINVGPLSQELSPGSTHDITEERYHAVLAVREVLKGKLKEKEIPILIRRDLRVTVGRKYGNSSQSASKSGVEEPVPKDLIQILKLYGPMAYLSVEDASKDHIWMVRHLWDEGGKREGEGTYGVRDPEDIQSLELKEYFQAYFSDNPEAEVWRYIVENPEFTERALNGLSNEKLSVLYNRPDPPHFQEQVVQIWTIRRCPLVVPILIERLEKVDASLAVQEIPDNWQGPDTEGNTIRTYHMLSHDLVRRLARVGDPCAIPAIRKIYERWASIPSTPERFYELCERTLRKLSETPTADAGEGGLRH